MIWATVRSQSSFCSLYRASPSSAAKNITNLILIWGCPCVESSLVLLEEGICSDHCVSWQTSFSLCPASFCIPRAHLPLTPATSWLATFALQSPMMKQTSFFFFFFLVLVLEGLVCLHRAVELQLLWHYWLRHRLGLLWYWMFSLEMNRNLSVVFQIAPKYCISDSEGYELRAVNWLWGLLHFF